MVEKKPQSRGLRTKSIDTCAFSIIKWAIKEEFTKLVRIKYSQSQAEYVHIGKYQI